MKVGNWKVKLEETRVLEVPLSFRVFFPLLSVITVAFMGMILNHILVDMIKLGILTLVLTFIALFYIHLNREDIFNYKYFSPIILGSYTISIILLMFPFQSGMVNLWMISGLITSILFDNKLGLLIHFNLSIMAGVVLSLQPENTMFLLIMGLLLNLLSSYLKQKETMVYAAIIILSTNITLAFVVNNFLFDTLFDFNYMTSFLGTLIVIVASILCSMLYEQILTGMKVTNASFEYIEEMQEQRELVNQAIKRHSDAEEDNLNHLEEMNEVMNQSSYNTVINSDVSNFYTDNISNLDLLLNEENELLGRLKAFSENIYLHAILIGNLSGKAALSIGADDKLAKAGGFYHEIGKINGKNYIEEGLFLADEYHFPKELKTILRQHNVKYDQPATIEAAIVMLSDNVVSTIDYIKKSNDKIYTSQKIIDHIFQLRMEKGTFDNSGLSVKDYKVLKEFYLSEFAKER